MMSSMNTTEISYQIDTELPNFEPSTRLDCWLNGLFKTCKCPRLSQVVKAALSTFTAPQIEASFCMINDINDKHFRRMDVPT